MDNFVTDQLKLLGLNSREIRTFTALATFGQQTMTALAVHARVPRTTVDAIVRRLVDQGLVTRCRVGKHYEYRVDLHDLAARLAAMKDRMVGSGESSLGHNNVDAASDGEPYDEKLDVTDHVTLHAVVEKHLRGHTGDRALMLVGSGGSTNKVERFFHCMDLAIQVGLKLEVLIGINDAKQMLAQAKELAEITQSGSVRLNFIPSTFVVYDTDILSFHDVALVIDHTREGVELISSPRAVAAVFHLMHIARDVGWGMDMNTWLSNEHRAVPHVT